LKSPLDGRRPRRSAPSPFRSDRVTTITAHNNGISRSLRGYTSVAVSALRRGVLRSTSVQRSADAGGLKRRVCFGKTGHSRASDQTVAHRRDASNSRFVMMGSGVRIPLAHQHFSNQKLVLSVLECTPAQPGDAQKGDLGRVWNGLGIGGYTAVTFTSRGRRRASSPTRSRSGRQRLAKCARS
jgi:hypothetical protein